VSAPVQPLTAGDHEVLTDAFERTHSPSDRIAYAMDQVLVDHPEFCSTDATYPGWIPGGAR
jgi:hypothetical protein